MKKISANILLLSFCLIFALTGCSDDKDKNDDSKYVTLGDYENIEVTVGKSDVTESSIQSYIERMISTYVQDDIQKPSYNELTDEFVEKYMQDTECKTVAELKQQVYDYLSELNEYYAKNNTRSAITEKLSKICTVNKIPDGLLDERISLKEKLFKANCVKQYGMEFDEYLTAYQLTEKAFHKQISDNAESEVESELILSEIAKCEGIKVNDGEIKKYAEQMLKDYGYESTKELYKDYTKKYVENACLCDKVLESLMKSTKVTFVAPGDIPSN